MNNETDSESPHGGEVRDRAQRPSGLVPKRAQAYVILGVAVVVIAALAFSGGNTQAKQAANSMPKPAGVIDPSPARIEQYRAEIAHLNGKIAADQSQLQQINQSGQTQGASGSTGAQQQTPEEQERAALEVEKIKREYQSLFASSVALTHRKDSESQSQTPSATASAPPKMPQYYPWPYPLPETTSAGLASPKQDPQARTARSPEERNAPDSSAQEEPSREHRAIDPSLQSADGKSYRLFEGTIIETVLTNRLDGSFNGPVNCMVTTDVYSHDLQRLLIPKGSRILGEAKRNNTFGQQRLAVFFHRVIMPDGYSASLDQFKGLSQIGETGLRDQVNHHYAQIFGVSLAIGAIAGLANANTGSGLNTSSTDAYRQGVASSLSQSSLHILDRFLNVLPTFTIREGNRIKIILSDDLMLPAYDRHKLPPDL